MITNYKFNAKEKDEETSLYYYGARYYSPELSIWLSVDPMADKYPSMSPFMYCAGNPVRLVDPNGMEVDPAASGYNDAEKAAKTQPEFAKIYNEWKADTKKLIKFNHITDDGSKGGSIGYEGKNEKGQDVYLVNWNPSITEQLGTSGIYEESYHLKEAIEGIEMEFAQNTSGDYGLKNLDIYDEVRAKLWVVKNIKGVKQTYPIGDDYYKRTHYGQVMTYNNVDVLANTLKFGMKDYLNIIDRNYNRNNTINGKFSNQKYIPMGFTGEAYRGFSLIKLP